MSPREVAIAVFASCAGAVGLARTIPARHGRERVLNATETMLVAALGLDGARAGSPRSDPVAATATRVRRGVAGNRDA
jgi:hypothetical protein